MYQIDIDATLPPGKAVAADGLDRTLAPLTVPWSHPLPDGTRTVRLNRLDFSEMRKSNPNIPVRPDVEILRNNSPNVIFIFGSAWGTFDFNNFCNSYKGADIIRIRDTSCSWYENGCREHDSIQNLRVFVETEARNYFGNRIFFGISMGGSAALYFGSFVKRSRTVVANPQLFRYQFSWVEQLPWKLTLIDMIGQNIDRFKSSKIDIIVGETETASQKGGYFWDDRKAASEFASLTGAVVHVKLGIHTHLLWNEIDLTGLLIQEIDKNPYQLSSRTDKAVTD
jgi:hypothetical protein